MFQVAHKTYHDEPFIEETPRIQGVQSANDNVEPLGDLKVAYMSDLHLEFEPYPYDLPEADVLILAGDTMTPTHDPKNPLNRFKQEHVDFVNETAEKYKYGILMVLGNHDYWNSSLCTTVQKFREALSHKVRVLQNDYVKIKGHRFHGTTLWTSLNNNNPHTALVVRNYMNDFMRVYDLTDKSWYQQHQEAMLYLKNHVLPGDVVITHHLPSWQSVDPRFKNQHLGNWGYASELDEFIEEFKPSVWIHGHTHCNHDYQIGKTRILCNSKGYYNENKEFKPDAYFEL